MDLLWKTALVYIIILIMIRLMGKREIGQLSLFDFVVLLLIADISAMAIDKGNNYFLYLLPILVLVFFQKVFSFLTLKIKSIRKLFDGEESIIIYNGKLDIKEMKKQFYNVDDLLTQTRLKNITSLKDIKHLFLETNGEISVFLKDDNITPIPASYVKSRVFNTNGASTESTMFAYSKTDNKIFPLITSGKVNSKYLKLLNIDINWLESEIKKQGYTIENVYYACLDNDKVFIMPTR